MSLESLTEQFKFLVSTKDDFDNIDVNNDFIFGILADYESEAKEYVRIQGSVLAAWQEIPEKRRKSAINP